MCECVSDECECKKCVRVCERKKIVSFNKILEHQMRYIEIFACLLYCYCCLTCFKDWFNLLNCPRASCIPSTRLPRELLRVRERSRLAAVFISSIAVCKREWFPFTFCSGYKHYKKKAIMLQIKLSTTYIFSIVLRVLLRDSQFILHTDF